ncbi:MAG: phenylalanine--tRNA ligase subunit beta, partial [Acidimicrobiaceae bacterium]|nr:phenylalanine--tRNA ligase subunit beta [Acidimicrobiaceae bacterium]
PDHLEVGSSISRALGIVPDVVFDLAIENNRPDANCVMGVARDLAAWLKIPFSQPNLPELANIDRKSSQLSGVDVGCLDQCDRLFVALYHSVVPKPTSELIARRLNLAGMRCVSPIVDISNYLMLELGQPTHPYDADALAGGTISVRLAGTGESLMTLDGVTRVLGLPDARGRQSTDVVIVDGHDRPVGVAGIMGGEESEIKVSTKNILLELAHFDPMTIARTSKRLGMRSEASARFERGVDPAIIELTLSRFSEMLGQQPVGIVEVSKPSATKKMEIMLRVSRLNQLLGTSIARTEVASKLTPIGFDVQDIGDGTLKVVVPTNRPDVEREIDVIEEVARHVGYRTIDKIRPNSKLTGTLKPSQKFRRQLASLVVGLGFYEAWCATLLAPGEQERLGDNGPFLEVENPLAQEESVLRRSLLPGLIRALRFNINRKEEEVRFFEFGKVFSLKGVEISETHRAAFLLGHYGDDVTAAMSVFSKISDYFSLMQTSLVNCYEIELGKHEYFEDGAFDESWTGLHPTRSAYVMSKGAIVGQVGEIDRQTLGKSGIELDRPLGYLELDIDRLMGLLPAPSVMMPVSQFPMAEVDLAFEVPDSVSVWDIENVLSHEVSVHVVAARLFDVWRGETLKPGFRSLAYSVRMSAMDRTLSETDIAEIRERCIAVVEDRFGSKLRS